MEIAVISGKGGTGKSSISAALATIGKKVVLADCDVDAANLFLIFEPVIETEEIYISGHKAVINPLKCSFCGKCINYCRFNAITVTDKKIVISDINCDGCFLCSHICPEGAIDMKQKDSSRMYAGSFRNGKMIYGRLAPGEENSGKLVSKVRDKAKQVAKRNRIDLIILDGPPGIGCPVLSTITGVDKAVLVTEPSLSGLSDLKRTMEVVYKFPIPVIVIINKADLNPSNSREITKYCHKSGIATVIPLPFDPAVIHAMVEKKSISEYAKDSEISKNIQNIYNILLDT